MAQSNRTWTDDPTVVGRSQCNPDILNEDIMYLKESVDNAVIDISNVGYDLTITKGSSPNVEVTTTIPLTTIQTDIESKADKTGYDINKVLITNSSGVISTTNNLTTTELGYLEGVTSNIQTQINTTANQSLSNLNATGQNILDNKLNTSQITNCILESPKMVDLTLDGTNLTYKANSRAIFPYGTSAPTLSIGDSFGGGKIVDISWDNSKLFYIVEYSVDKTRDLSSFTTGESMLYFDLSGYLTVSPISFFSAGATATTNRFWYDTTTNFCKWSSDGSGTFDQIGRSLPFAIIGRSTTNELLRIKQVFQNVGYIGNWGWVNKGLKFLAPNGRNEDGTLKNIEKVQSKVNVQGLGASATGTIYYLMLYTAGTWRNASANVHYIQDEKPVLPQAVTHATWYSPSENIFRNTNNGDSGWITYNLAIVGSYYSFGGTISNFNVNETFKAVDYNEMLNGQIPTIIESYKNGKSWYRVYSDGWCKQGGFSTLSASTQAISFLKTMKDTNFTVRLNGIYTSYLGAYPTILSNTITTTGFNIQYDNTYPSCYWEVEGYIKM